MISREEMIEHQLKGRDIHNSAVLRAMSVVDRELFVPARLREKAYNDSPLPIGKKQTISQPYIVAYMTQALKLGPDSRVLEIGTGCGYNAAVLSQIAAEVYSIEIIEWLADLARINLRKTGYHNISLRHADGYFGWPESAPFDGIVLTAAPPQIPETLKQQLKPGGILVAPVGRNRQQLVLIHRTTQGNFEEKNLIMVSFVPMMGKAQDQNSPN